MRYSKTILAATLSAGLLLPAVSVFAKEGSDDSMLEPVLPTGVVGQVGVVASGSAESGSDWSQPSPDVTGRVHVDAAMGRQSGENEGVSEHQGSSTLERDDEGEIEIDHQSALGATSTLSDVNKVTNRGQLRSFLNHVVKADGNIADVTVSSTTVQTRYVLPTKFLGVIPTNLTANVSVGTDGSITIDYPWYAFLFSKKGSELKTQLMNVASTTSASTTLTASAQAHLLNMVLDVLKGSK